MVLLNILASIKDNMPELVGLQTAEDYIFILVIPIVLTFLFSGFVGIERQNMGKAAGVSAHILVALSSAALGIMQRLMLAYEFSLNEGSFQGQRVIAQVITGIGFIGAGVIMKDKFTVKGLTTDCYYLDNSNDWINFRFWLLNCRWLTRSFSSLIYFNKRLKPRY